MRYDHQQPPRRVLQVACCAFPAYRHKFGPKKFTQSRLMACLALKEFLCLEYRGFAEHLDAPRTSVASSIRSPARTPSTLQQVATRLLRTASARAVFDDMLDRPLRAKVRRRRVPTAAFDGTGMESRHVGRYEVKGRSRTGTGTRETTYLRYPKVVPVTDCRTHSVLTAVPGRGPASDLGLFETALRQAGKRPFVLPIAHESILQF